MGWGLNQYALVRIPIRKPCEGYYIRWYYNGWHYWFFHPGKYGLDTEGEKYRTIGTRRLVVGSGQVTRGQMQAIRTIMNTREVYLLTIAGWMNIRVEPSSINIYNEKVAGAEMEMTIIIGSKEISYQTGFTPVPGDGYLPELPIVPPSIDYCEVIIGEQVWMCRNFDSNFPGSKAYNDNPAYADIYGRLYDFTMVNSPGFAPLGWHVPTLAEWNTLINYVGGLATAGGELKEVGLYHWDNPNTGALDTYNFTAFGGGFYGFRLGYGWGYHYLRQYGQYMAKDGVISIRYNTTAIEVADAVVSNYFGSVRLIKDTPPDPFVYDYDGNMYDVIEINGQEWTVQNLKVTHYSDGNAIPNIENGAAWAADVNGALCYYNNDIGYKAEYGALYNAYAMENASQIVYVTRNGQPQTDWRIPTKTDFDNLVAFFGGSLVAGGALKETGLDYWDAPNAGATNSSGFTFRGTGEREAFFQLFLGIRTLSPIWSSTKVGVQYYGLAASNSNTQVDHTTLFTMIYGYGIRLVRDI